MTDRLIARCDRRVALLLAAVGVIVMALFGATRWVVANAMTTSPCVSAVTAEIGAYPSPSIEGTC